MQLLAQAGTGCTDQGVIWSSMTCYVVHSFLGFLSFGDGVSMNVFFLICATLLFRLTCWVMVSGSVG